jgi:hypothetical protein
MRTDYRDLVIEHLSLELDDAQAALVDARRVVDSYQQMVRAALDQLAELVVQNSRLRACVNRRIEIDQRHDDLEAAA